MVRTPGGPGARPASGLTVPFRSQYQIGGSGTAGNGAALPDRVDVIVNPQTSVGTTSPNTFFRIVKLAWSLIPFEQLPASGNTPFLGIYLNDFVGDFLLHGVTDCRLGGLSQCDILLTRGDTLLCKFEDIPVDGNLYTASVTGRMYVESSA